MRNSIIWHMHSIQNTILKGNTTQRPQFPATLSFHTKLVQSISALNPITEQNNL